MTKTEQTRVRAVGRGIAQYFNKRRPRASTTIDVSRLALHVRGMTDEQVRRTARVHMADIADHLGMTLEYVTGNATFRSHIRVVVS